MVSLSLALAALGADPVPLDVTANARKLNPGQFEWSPERSPKGPLLVVCSLDDQMLYAFRNGIQIARSTISTGREGKRTPTGVFTILQRKIDHESNIYKGAKMPYMQRLTWTGIAMHAGELPGYPASAGCIRLPYEFSKLIYGEMKNGSTVVITEKNASPTKSNSPSTILKESEAPDEADKSIPKGRPIWEPHKSLHGPISILLSYADRTLYVWRNGVQIGQCPVAYDLPENQLPEGVFLMLEGGVADPKTPGLTLYPWSVVSLDGDQVEGNVVDYIRDNFRLDPTFRKLLNKVVEPGTLFLATRESSTEETRSGLMAIGQPEPEAKSE